MRDRCETPYRSSTPFRLFCSLRLQKSSKGLAKLHVFASHPPNTPHRRLRFSKRKLPSRYLPRMAMGHFRLKRPTGVLECLNGGRSRTKRSLQKQLLRRKLQHRWKLLLRRRPRRTNPGADCKQIKQRPTQSKQPAPSAEPPPEVLASEVAEPIVSEPIPIELRTEPVAQFRHNHHLQLLHNNREPRFSHPTTSRSAASPHDGHAGSKAPKNSRTRKERRFNRQP